jgi:hypothetical protein
MLIVFFIGNPLLDSYPCESYPYNDDDSRE